MIHYRYGRLGTAAITELIGKLQARESIVLLGPQLIGKVFFLSRLISHLKDLQYSTPIYVACHPIEESVFGGSSWLQHCNPEAVEVEPKSKAIFERVDHELASTGSALLIITNIDSLPYAEARDILIQVRTRVDSRQGGSLSVIITGEMSLTQLVYGPNSEFTCANQYVVQGLDQELFEEYARLYAQALHFKWDLNSASLKNLYHQTGGNAQLLRLILLDLHQSSGPQSPGMKDSLDSADVDSTINSQRICDEVIRTVFHGYVSRIDRHSEDLERVYQLLRNGEVDAKAIPELIELTGIAIRDGGVLRAFSPFVKSVLEKYYTPRRLAELYFTHGSIKQAEECFQSIKGRSDMSIDRQEDADQIEAKVRWLTVQLYSRVYEGVEGIQSLLEQGCRYLLDSTRVKMFVRQKRSGEVACWRMVTKTDRSDHVPDEELREYYHYLDKVRANDEFDHSPSMVRRVYSVEPGSDHREGDGGFGVIVGSPTGSALSPEFRRLVHDLLEHFVEAHKRAYLIAHTNIRNQRLGYFATLFDDIIRELGGDIINVPAVLKLAAERIRALGYHRVLFSVLDPMEGVIRGVIDNSEDGVNLAAMTRYPQKSKDIQSYVCVKKKTRIVLDAPNDRLANREAVQIAGLKAFAVIPMISRSNRVIGTLHIERMDREPLAADELQDFEGLAQRLAIALDQVERVNHLQAATDGLEEALFVVDRSMRVRYANKVAGQFLGIEPGWKNRRSLNHPIHRNGTAVAKSIEDQVKSTLTSRAAILGHLPRTSTEPETYDLITKSINSAFDEGVTVGAVGHVRNLTYLYRVFNALERIQSCQDEERLIHGLLDAMQVLGHRWARLYLVSKESRNVFQSHDCFGSEDSAFEDRFRSGEFKLKSADEPGHESWVCADEKKPTVFYCAQPGQTSATIRSERGLEATVIIAPKCPSDLKKSPGDYWIDFPILRGPDVLGKVTLACEPKDFGPEELEFLKILVKLINAQFNAIRTRNESEWHKRNAMSQAVYHTCHNISTRLAVYPALIWRYKRLTLQVPELHQVNQDFERIHRGVLEVITRATKHLTSVAIELIPCDFERFIKTCFQRILGEQDLLELVVEPIGRVAIDTHAFESVICELVENSRHCLPVGKHLAVKVSVRRSQSSSGETMLFEYADNGPGIAPDVKEKVFKEFVSQRKGGTGLGLAYIRRVIDAHQGQICEQGAFGEGAHFKITMPMVRAE